MMDFVTVEKEKIMAEYITCRRCDSPDCKGCNLKRLETMMENGKFDCLMNENRAINTSADVASVKHGRWIERKHFRHDHYIDSTYECSECNVEEPLTSDYCPNCGAKMNEEVISGSSGD